jgi:hypothetical protein
VLTEEEGMFQYDYPQFEKKRLLRVEMLDKLRDYPKNYLDLSLKEYGDGVICGCKITWDNERLTIDSGMIYWKKNLYFMEQPFVIDCKAEDKVRYLKVQFMAEIREAGRITANTRIFLEDKKPDPSCEMELCRFRLQEGARLRDSHENFQDYSTAFDTLNIISQPYGAPGGTTLNPCIIRQFSREVLRSGTLDPFDISFSTMALSNHGQVAPELLQEYLLGKLEEDYSKKSNKEIYNGLSEVLRTRRSGEIKRTQGNQGKRGMMLL